MKKWEIKTLEPIVDMDSERAIYSYYQTNIIEADMVDVHEGLLIFSNEVPESDEARIVAGYTIANIVSFKEITDGQTTETPVH